MDLQMSTAPMVPGDIPRLYIHVAKAVPYWVLAEHICVPAICRIMDNLICSALLAKPPEGKGDEMREVTRTLTQSDKVVTGIVLLS